MSIIKWSSLCTTTIETEYLPLYVSGVKIIKGRELVEQSK